MMKEYENTLESIIYVVNEIEQLKLLPEKAIKIKTKASLQVIKERFAQRIGGFLPPPVETMLEKKHGQYDGISYDILIEDGNLSFLKEKVREAMEQRIEIT